MGFGLSEQFPSCEHKAGLNTSMIGWVQQFDRLQNHCLMSKCQPYEKAPTTTVIQTSSVLLRVQFPVCWSTSFSSHLIEWMFSRHVSTTSTFYSPVEVNVNIHSPQSWRFNSDLLKWAAWTIIWWSLKLNGRLTTLFTSCLLLKLDNCPPTCWWPVWNRCRPIGLTFI